MLPIFDGKKINFTQSVISNNVGKLQSTKLADILSRNQAEFVASTQFLLPICRQIARVRILLDYSHQSAGIAC